MVIWKARTTQVDSLLAALNAISAAKDLIAMVEIQSMGMVIGVEDPSGSLQAKAFFRKELFSSYGYQDGLDATEDPMQFAIPLQRFIDSLALFVVAKKDQDVFLFAQDIDVGMTPVQPSYNNGHPSTQFTQQQLGTANGVFEMRFNDSSRELNLVMDTEGAHYPLSTFITLQTLEMSSLASGRPLQQLEIEGNPDGNVEEGHRPGEAVVPTFILKNAIDDLDWINADVQVEILPFPSSEIRMKSNNLSSGISMSAVIPGVEHGGTAKIDNDGSPVTAFFKLKHLRAIVASLPNLREKDSEEAVSKIKIDHHGLLSVQHMIPISQTRHREIEGSTEHKLKSTAFLQYFVVPTLGQD